MDLERDKLIDDIKRAGHPASESWVDGFHTELQARNGAGDPWRTDGRLAIGVILI